MARNGYLIRKFFLHISKEEQRRRFLSRLEEPDKRWKFMIADVEERKRWGDYMRAYEDMIRHTSAPHAPWIVVRPTGSGMRAVSWRPPSWTRSRA